MNPWEKLKRNLISRATTIYYFKNSIWDTQETKNYEAHKETGKYAPHTHRKQSIEAISDKAQALDLLDKDFKLVHKN